MERSQNTEILPRVIETVEQLEEILSRPYPQLADFMKQIEGDIMVLGAGGKIGPTMTQTVRRAIDAAGVEKNVIAVDAVPFPTLEAENIQTIVCDLLDLDAVRKLPKTKNIIYMAGRKFGSSGSEHLTWAINVIAPHNVARTFTNSRIAVFSSGCVYPIMDVSEGSATERTTVEPIGEYAMSCLGRERMFDYYCQTCGTNVVQLRLNYAVELRYGVLVDVASKVFNSEPIDLTTGYANVIWQGDACNQILLSLSLASSPAKLLNVTGPETFSVRQVAKRFGELLNKQPIFRGQENGRAYLSDATQANKLFGHPRVPFGRIIEWTAHWIRSRGPLLGKPTHYETQDGKY